MLAPAVLRSCGGCFGGSTGFCRASVFTGLGSLDPQAAARLMGPPRKEVGLNTQY